jgi:hypothetical protein
MENDKQQVDPQIKADEIIASAKIASDKVIATATLEREHWLYIDDQGKQKIFEILITAILSAGIAFLTNILAHITATNLPQANVEKAGIIGGIIKTMRSGC